MGAIVARLRAAAGRRSKAAPASSALPRQGASSAGLLRVLLVSSLLAPLLLFLAASWLNYRTAFADARRDLLRVSEVAREHAAKVLDGQSQVADRVNDLLRGMDVATIRQSEAALHDAFARIVARLPQVQSVLLVSRGGTPLVSAQIYPVPNEIDLRARDFFRALVEGYNGTYVSRLQTGGVSHKLFFGLARPWIAAGGTLEGVIDVAVSPKFFQDFYDVLIGEGADGAGGRVITLIRDDGQILVRSPPFAGPPPVAPSTGDFSNAVRAHKEAGTYESRSIIDTGAPARVFAYRKVQGYPVYVVAGRSRDAIAAGWRKTMASHLVFGLPATLALFAITWTALVRARREDAALAWAGQEMTRRETAEAALLSAQRLDAVGQMTGGVAHDFNNLLTVILGSAERLGRRADDPDSVRRIAGQIVMAAQRGGEVTQQLLAFSRRQLLKPEIVDLNERLQAFRQLLDRAAREAVRVDLDLDSRLHLVRLHPGHFEAAILNLVGNARDAMPDGGRIVIATRNLDRAADAPASLGDGDGPADAFVRVAVCDTGCGMDPQTAGKAFEPFFTTKSVGQGTGLGLSQVYGFAKQAGGDVRILSTPGIGTTVELFLPRARELGATVAPSAPAPPLRQACDGEVVLVVEDDPRVLETVVENLHDLGYATIAAGSAQAALERLRTGARVDVLFSDVIMPGGLNGLQLVAQARRLRADLKVILTSGYSGATEAEPPAGVPLLTKPYERAQLAEALGAALHG